MSWTDRRFGNCAEPKTWKVDRDGFAVLHAFLDRIEIQETKALVETALRLPRHSLCDRPHNILVPLRWCDPLVGILAISERRLEVLRAVSGGHDLRWISGYISIKEAFSPPLWWHQDWWCWDHPVSFRHDAVQAALLCYLTETNNSNGALRVLPGSHLKSVAIHAVLPEAHSQNETLQSEHAAVSDLAGQVTLDLRAGDAVLLDYRLLHGTHANTTASRRDCLIFNFAPSWETLPDDIKAHLIRHPALPSENEAMAASKRFAEILPSFAGKRKSLPLNRNAPSEFEAVDH